MAKTYLIKEARLRLEEETGLVHFDYLIAYNNNGVVTDQWFSSEALPEDAPDVDHIALINAQFDATPTDA